MKGFLRTMAFALLMLVALMTIVHRDSSGWIAFMSFRDGDAAVYLMSEQGGAARKISPDGICGYEPQWSSDGQWITFIDFCVGSSDLYRIRPSGGSFSVVASEPEFIQSGHWSPDGQRLLLEADNYDVYVVNADGRMLRHMTTETFFPEWSPDSQWIYTQPQLNEDSGFNRIHAASGRIEFLLPPFAAVNDWDWSPDGESMVISLANTESLGNGLFLMEPDGSNIRMIAEADTPEQFFEVLWGDEWIILIAGEGNDNRHLYRIRPDGSGMQRLSQRAGAVYNMQWSSDGEWVIYRGNYDGQEHIYRLRVSESESGSGSSEENLTASNDASNTFNSDASVAPINGRAWRPGWLIVVAVGMLVVSVLWRLRS